MNLLHNQNFKRISIATLAFGGMLAASVAVAGNHGGYGGYGGHGYQKDPSFVDRGDTLLAYGQVRGVKKNRNVRVEIDAEARVRVECRRHGGGYHGGQSFSKTIYIDLDGSKWYNRNDIHGNRLDFSVETDDIYDIDDYYGYVCPGNYRAHVKGVRFSSAKVSVRQGHSSVVTWLCSFDRDTKNGKVPRNNVECHTL